MALLHVQDGMRSGKSAIGRPHWLRNLEAISALPARRIQNFSEVGDISRGRRRRWTLARKVNASFSAAYQSMSRASLRNAGTSFLASSVVERLA